MLNKTEKAVMDVVFNSCGLNGACIISEEEIKLKLKDKKIDGRKIKSTLNSLSLDKYFDLLLCDRHGEEVYCINLLTKGYSFKRETEQEKRSFVYKILLAVLTGAITYIVGKLLFWMF